MTEDKPYLVVSYYKIFDLTDPSGEVKRHKAFFLEREMTGRIYFSVHGVNAQFSGLRAHVKEYLDWLGGDERYQDIDFKIQEYHENCFPKVTIKARPELVAMGEGVDFDKRGEHVAAHQWREMLESDEEYLKLDVRNDYEWELGRFKGFEKPHATTFRDFPVWAKQLKEEYDPKKTKVMMCCTGGIRCEFYSALLKDEGFEEVYQLDGGILKYGEKEEGKHWDGKLFVFDDRLAVDVNPKAEATGRCLHCSAIAEHPYNCANMDCNKLFLCCHECLEKELGCCSKECVEGTRVRPVSHQTNKPFRKWYHYIDEKERLSRKGADQA